MLKDYDFILGLKTMYEARPNFGYLTFDMKKRSIPLHNMKQVTVELNSQKEIWLNMTWSTKDFQHAQEAIKITHKHIALQQTMKVSVLNKKVKILMANNDNQKWHIPVKTIPSSIDMRSMKYFL